MEQIETLFIELTTACNLKCIHCGYKNISSHNIDKIYIYEAIKQLECKGLQNVMLTGGEPTLHPDFLEILSVCKANNLRTKVATNGTRYEIIRVAFERNLLDEVVISADAISRETFLSIRHADALRAIYRNITLSEHYNKFISLSFLIQKNNYKELPDFLEHTVDLNINRVSLLVPHYNGDFTEQLSIQQYQNDVFLTLDDSRIFVQEVAPYILEFWKAHPNILHYSKSHIDALISYLSDMYNPKKYRESMCSLPLKTLFLYSDGTIRLCPYQKQWAYEGIDIAINDLSHRRIKCYFESKSRESYCNNCLEVPL